MMDNHTVTEHQEIYKPVITSITRLQDIADRVHEIPEFRPAAAALRMQPSAPLMRDLKNSNNTDSMCTTNSGAHEDAAKDSGCDLADSSSADSANSSAGEGDGHKAAAPTMHASHGSEGVILRRGSSSADGELEMDDGIVDTTPIEMPSDELAAQIVAQVQFYFSNENILKDAFLLKHVRRNKEGFVSLKLISSFKRVRQLTKDWRVVGVAIRRVQALTTATSGGVATDTTAAFGIEVNDLGTKVRRLDALPSFDETMPSRTVVATDLPVERLSIESVSELFGKCGEIALIRILRPGGTIPTDVRQFYNKHPDLHERECALIEFTESMAARRAQELPGLQTYEMVAPKKKTGKKAPGNLHHPGGTGFVHSAGGMHSQATVSRIVENYRYPSYVDAERSRGGADMAGGDFKYSGLRRGSAGYFVKYHDGNNGSSTNNGCHHHHPRRTSFGGVMLNGGGNSSNGGGQHDLAATNAGGEHYDGARVVPRRLSQCSLGSGGDLMLRKFSNCSDGYCASDAISRRTSACSQDSTRRASQCSMMSGADAYGLRRQSQCSDYCVCSTAPRRQCAAAAAGDAIYRRNGPTQQSPPPQSTTSSSCLEHGGGYQQQRYVGGSRRVSFDSEYAERKLSSGSFGYERKLSMNNGTTNGYEMMRKISSDKFYDARKISADSGYDRRSSIGSMSSEHHHHRCMAPMVSMSTSPPSSAAALTATGAPAAATGSVGGQTKVDAYVRTPIGPDGSKGFTARARKVGHVVGPI